MSITITNIPEANSLLLDGNNTIITATSTNGDGYYFRANIYINDVLFDQQGWSRKDDYTAEKDLLFLYHAYFEPERITFVSGVEEQTHLIRKVKIIIEEKQISDDALVDYISLPEFYIMYNNKSSSFDENAKTAILGVDPEVIRIHKTGTIVLPIYVNATAEDLTITIKDDIGNTLKTDVVAAITGKKIFLYTLNLSDVTILYNHTYLEAFITVGDQTISKVYSIIRLPNYEINEIVFQNNYGYYIPAYFDGDLEDSSGYKIETYENKDNSIAVYAIEEEGSYTINTGNLNSLEKDIINQIALSVDTFLKNNNKYISINTTTKKTTNYKSRLNIYTQDLTFSFKKGLPFDNTFNNTTIVTSGLELYATINNSENHNSTLIPNVYKKLKVTIYTDVPLSSSFAVTIYQAGIYPNPSVVLEQQIFNDAGYLIFDSILVTNQTYYISTPTLWGDSSTYAVFELINI